MKQESYIKVREKEIPVIIRSYKTAKHLKMYFKANVLYVSKPIYVSNKKAFEFIKENEKFIYDQLNKIENNNEFALKKWENGEVFFYKGEKYNVQTNLWKENKINIQFEDETKSLKLCYPASLELHQRKLYIDRGIKKILKNNTEYVLARKLPYWSKKTNIAYHDFKVNDATSKFGSCIPATRNMHFSSRLIMLPEDKIHAVVVHELCHIIYPNHSKDFYNLVRKYIPDYDEINKWLKKNGKMIMF